MTLKGQKSRNNYILVTFDLDMNDDILITIDRSIMYHISNKMTRCQLISKKDRMSIVSFVYKWQDIINGLSNEKR